MPGKLVFQVLLRDAPHDGGPAYKQKPENWPGGVSNTPHGPAKGDWAVSIDAKSIDSQKPLEDVRLRSSKTLEAEALKEAQGAMRVAGV